MNSALWITAALLALVGGFTKPRQSLNRLRALARRRESYMGPWPPEPMRTAPDVAENAELASSSTARRRSRPGGQAGPIAFTLLAPS